MRAFLRLAGWTNILAAALLVLGWLSTGIFTWEEISEQNFSAMVLNQVWIPANVLLLIATVLLLPCISGLFIQLSDGFGKWLLTGEASRMLRGEIPFTPVMPAGSGNTK